MNQIIITNHGKVRRFLETNTQLTIHILVLFSKEMLREVIQFAAKGSTEAVYLCKITAHMHLLVMYTTIDPRPSAANGPAAERGNIFGTI